VRRKARQTETGDRDGEQKESGNRRNRLKAVGCREKKKGAKRGNREKAKRVQDKFRTSLKQVEGKSAVGQSGRQKGEATIGFRLEGKTRNLKGNAGEKRTVNW
jgi:hypothetical protein